MEKVATDYCSSHLDKGGDYDLDLSAGFDQYMTEREREIVSRVVPALFSGRAGRSIDFACGTGRLTQLIETLAEESWGIDISHSMVEEAKVKCSRTSFIVGDATRECPEIGEADLVTAFRFFPNAEERLRVVALEAIRKMLKDGGYLIINNHRNSTSIHRLLTGGDRRCIGISQRLLKRLLLEHGFRIVRAYGIGVAFLRYRFARPGILDSRLFRMLEPLSLLPSLDLICPDSVIVAQKISPKTFDSRVKGRARGWGNTSRD
ncbi:MAG TPA: class I SAM-dependent methyltransferase [Thermoanaerobaculia bacterium]